MGPTGLRTPSFPEERYFHDVSLRHFDLVLIVSESRFTETDLRIQEDCEEKGAECFFVRTKIDSDVENESRDNDLEMSTVLCNIRKELEEHRVKSDRLFLVSSVVNSPNGGYEL